MLIYQDCNHYERNYNRILHFPIVSSGTVTINEDSSLQVLAEEAVPLEQLDMSVSDVIV
jgi:hypothetical protein